MAPFSRTFPASLRRAGAPLLSFVFPADCFVCGRPLERHQMLGACLDCWAGLAPLRSPACRRCGVPIPRDTDLLGAARGTCAHCLNRHYEHEGVVAAVLYENVARRFLLRAKFGGWPEILPVLGAQLAAAASRSASSCTFVVPVPSHPWTLLRRGFNPAAWIARPVSRRLGLPLRTGVVSRSFRSRGPVKRMGAGRRAAALHGAFRSAPLPGLPRILVVDDVMTTGATAEACAAALKIAGAAEVRIAVWARTPPRL